MRMRRVRRARVCGLGVRGLRVITAMPVHRMVHRRNSCSTLSLSEPADYGGGELIVEDTFGSQSIKLPAGDLILYPASSVHRVNPVTRGTRTASFFWIESMVRDDAQRRVLFDLDLAIHSLRRSCGDRDELVRLTGCYHNLVRLWAQT